MDGKWLDAARWEVESLVNLKEGQDIQVFLANKDEGLEAYVTKSARPECYVDRDKDSGVKSMVVTMKIMKFKHLLEGGKLESMVIVTSASRLAESALLYLLDKPACDPRFIAAVRQSTSL